MIYGPQSSFALNIMNNKYAKTKADGTKENWEEIARRVTDEVMSAVPADAELKQQIFEMIRSRKFMPGGRYLYAAGNDYHQTQNCLLLRAEDSREGWSDLMYKSSMALMSGAGIGVDYSAVRPEGSLIKRTGGFATGPIALMKMVNEAGRNIMQGGSRRSAIWAGLNWAHQDVIKFIVSKNWSEDIRKLKTKDFNFPATLDGTNVSVILDKPFFDAYHDSKNGMNSHAHNVYWAVVRQMLSTSEPGFSVDYDNPRESLRNACCEIVSEDDSDICNLGSLNLAQIDSLEDFVECVNLGTTFLLAGTVYSHVPYAQVDNVRTKNRRLGLGLMGIHEWLLKRGKSYGPDAELQEWLEQYVNHSTSTAIVRSLCFDVSTPIKTRGVAPNGTIGIVAETTTGIEPIFCAAYKRRYLKGESWHYEYVLDPTAKRLVDAGVSPDAIEDAYTLAADIERRVAFQAWVQQFVDHAISSTINMPAWGSELNNESKVQDFGTMLLKYLPKMRGVTAYADGSRGGQPLTPVKYQTAMKHVSQIFVEQADVCSISERGSCGE